MIKEKKKRSVVTRWITPPITAIFCLALLCTSLCALSHRLSLLGVAIALAPMLLVALLSHELGHLLVALACGWRFVSFSALSLTIARSGGGLRVERNENPAALWQCLTAPNSENASKKSTILVNLGGFIGNACLSLLLAVLSIVFVEHRIILSVLYTGALISLAVGIENLIPMRAGLACNDGYNALSVLRDAQALSMVRLLRINALKRELRLRDMPQELFELDEAELSGIQTAALAYQKFLRLMDQADYDSAYALGMRLLVGEADLLPIYHGLLALHMAYVCAVVYRDPVLAGSYIGARERRLARQLSDLPQAGRVAGVEGTEK